MALSRQCIANDSRHDNALQMIQLKMFKRGFGLVFVKSIFGFGLCEDKVGGDTVEAVDGQRRGGDGGGRMAAGDGEAALVERGRSRTVEAKRRWRQDGLGTEAESEGRRGRWRPERRQSTRPARALRGTVEARTVETRTVETGTVEAGTISVRQR
ncbi:hypothetical protein Scep_026075 [Stephania cephalantha]|uniref:Uncharacterized protein n=1 Tax=Stephania cephalantha TaxID=152367 RepID=A0AAP0HS55_9MAGN